jgi:hypothetical protein
MRVPAWLLLALFVAILAVCRPQSADATIFIVNTSADVPSDCKQIDPNVSACSFRDAVNSANSNPGPDSSTPRRKPCCASRPCSRDAELRIGCVRW